MRISGASKRLEMQNSLPGLATGFVLKFISQFTVFSFIHSGYHFRGCVLGSDSLRTLLFGYALAALPHRHKFFVALDVGADRVALFSRWEACWAALTLSVVASSEAASLKWAALYPRGTPPGAF
jgi:hypothetical protein